jgi:hypothetical protein
MSGVTIVLDEVTPLMERIRDEAARSGLTLVMLRSVATLTRQHLFDLNAERHKYGRNYYAQAARSVNSRLVPQGGAISITQVGFRQRRFGGPIKPKAPRKYLTIPASPEAYGKRASEFPDLDFGMGLDANGNLRPALIRRASTAIKFVRRKRRDGTIKTTVKATEVRGGEALFWLVRSVNQNPDPSVLPPEPLMVATAIEHGKRRLRRLADRNA